MADKKRARNRKETSITPSEWDSDPFAGMRSSFPFARPLDFGRGLFARSLLDKWPRVDVVEDKDSIRVRADLPGITKDRIKLRVNPWSITISAESAEQKDVRQKDYFYRERSERGYYRTVDLPAEVNKNTAKAKFENGTLEIVMRKAERGSEVKVE